MRQPRYAVIAVVFLLCSGAAAGCKQGSEKAAEQQIGLSQTDSANAADGKVFPADGNDQRSVAQRLHDVSIAANVRLKLADQSGIDISKIGLRVDNGQVTLQGDVPSPEVRMQAERITREVGGVRQIVNQLNAPAASGVASAPKQQRPQPGISAPAPQAKAPTPRQTPPAPKAAEPAAKYYTVRSGDNLWTIARKSGTTVAQLKRLNDISGSNLRPGQKLRIK